MLTRTDAHNILQNCHITLGADYHALPSEQVERLLECAKSTHYRKPRNANGSTGRYFHAYVQRQASKPTAQP